MKKIKTHLFFRIILCAGLIMLTGCAKHSARVPVSSMDSAVHHVFQGKSLLLQEEWVEAEREFVFALELDAEYAPAYTGAALANGYQGNFSSAFPLIKQAKKLAEDKKQKTEIEVALIRLYGFQKEKGWLSKAKNCFNKISNSKYYQPEANYYMGIAYKEALILNLAELHFSKVLDLNTRFVEDADEQLQALNKINRAVLGTKVGETVALDEGISRAGLAALLMHELQLDKIFLKEGRKSNPLVSIPEDIKDHPLRSDIISILKLRLRGLKLFPDGSYKADKLITRATYSIVTEDIISLITHNPDLARMYIGSPSPFPDVPHDIAYFNSVMVCVSRGILQIVDIETGEFNPEGSVSGAEALLAVRTLKEKIRVYN